MLQSLEENTDEGLAVSERGFNHVVACEQCVQSSQTSVLAGILEDQSVAVVIWITEVA